MAEDRKSYSEGQILDLSRQTGRSTRTIRRWAMQGCDLDDPEEIRSFQERMEARKPACPSGPGRQIRIPVTRDTAIGRLPSEPERYKTSQEPSGSAGKGELSEPGRKGAAGALQRLEASEEEAHRRLQAALER